LRCQKQHKSLPNLGKMMGAKWCTNANYLTLAFHPGRKVYPSRGPTITAGIRFFGDNNYKGSRFMIEDGGVPDLLFDSKENLKNPTGEAQRFGDALRELYKGLNQQPFETLMPWFAQGRDEPIGKVSGLNRGSLDCLRVGVALELGSQRSAKGSRQHPGSAPEVGRKDWGQFPHPVAGRRDNAASSRWLSAWFVFGGWGRQPPRRIVRIQEPLCCGWFNHARTGGTQSIKNHRRAE
jgi:hypothetical protein